jgi:hypothetical protein
MGMVVLSPTSNSFLRVGASSSDVFSATAMLHFTHQVNVRSPATIEAHADTLIEIMFHGLVRER